MAHGWPDAIDMNDWMRQQEKRTGATERRPLIRHAADLMGPGLGPFAVRVEDWNTDETAFNGIFYSEPNSLNSPDAAAYWMGWSFANPDGGGLQRVWEYRDGTTSTLREFERTFITVPGSLRAFGPWVQINPTPTAVSVVSSLTPTDATIVFATSVRGREMTCINWRVIWTGATVTAGATGNIGDITVLSGFPVGSRPTVNAVIGIYGCAGRGSGDFTLSNTGALNLRTLSPGATIVAGDPIIGTLTFAPAS